MLSRLRRHLTFANVGVIVALVLAGSGFAAAAIPGPGGVIQACFSKSTGTVRVIDSKKHCTRRERAIRWNQQGRPGATGARGAAGTQGPNGSDAQFNGAAAGGDLTGSYPAPTVAPGAITGAKVAGNSLTGAQIDESSLGRVPDSQAIGGVPSTSIPERRRIAFKAIAGGSISTIPPAGIGIGLACPTSPSTGTMVTITNKTGGPIDVLMHDTSPASTVTFSDALANDASFSTGIDTTTDTVRLVTFQVIGGGASSGATIHAMMTRRSSGSVPCRGAMQSVS
jgi:hypothetical protein